MGRSNPNYIYEKEGKIWKRSCKLSLCEMEREFVLAIKDILEDPVEYRAAHQDNYNIFDDPEKCSSEVGLPKFECCGTHLPAGRMPYDSAWHDCCEGTELKEIGTCA